MTFQPVLPALVFVIVAVAVVASRLLVLRRTTGRTPSATWRWCGVTLAALLLLAAAARPVSGTDAGITRTAGGGNPNVFLLVDRSVGMGTEDAGGGRSRLTAAQADIAAVMDRYPDARFAVISFASRPSLDWPLSADAWSLRPVVSALTPYAATPDGLSDANVAAAGNVLRYQLIGAVQQYPRARNLVYYFGAGAGDSGSPPRQFNLPEGAVDGGAVLGYGTPGGGPVPALGDVRSAIDEPALRAVAGQIGVPYVARTGGPALAEAAPDPGLGAAEEVAAPAATPRTEWYWTFAIGAAALLLVELYLVLRDVRRSRLGSGGAG